MEVKALQTYRFKKDGQRVQYAPGDVFHIESEAEANALIADGVVERYDNPQLELPLKAPANPSEQERLDAEKAAGAGDAGTAGAPAGEPAKEPADPPKEGEEKAPAEGAAATTEADGQPAKTEEAGASEGAKPEEEKQ